MAAHFSRSFTSGNTNQQFSSTWESWDPQILAPPQPFVYSSLARANLPGQIYQPPSTALNHFESSRSFYPSTAVRVRTPQVMGQDPWGDAPPRSPFVPFDPWAPGQQPNQSAFQHPWRTDRQPSQPTAQDPWATAQRRAPSATQDPWAAPRQQVQNAMHDPWTPTRFGAQPVLQDPWATADSQAQQATWCTWTPAAVNTPVRGQNQPWDSWTPN